MATTDACRTVIEETRPAGELSVSYVVPTYNRPTWAARAVSSIVCSSQGASYPIEVVVTDDSTSRDVMEAVLPILRGGKCDYRVLANSPPAGMAGNWNLGVSSARGRYVAFVHDDDYVTANAVRDHHVELQHYPRSVYLFGVRVVDASGRRARIPKRVTEGDHAPGSAVRMLLRDSSLVRFPGILALREVYTDSGGFDASLGAPADVDMWLRLFAARGVRIVPSVTACYTLHDSALTASMFNTRSISAINRIFERAKCVSDLTLPEIESARADFITKFLVAGALRSLRSRKLSQARSVLELRDCAALTRRARTWLEPVYRMLRMAL